MAQAISSHEFHQLFMSEQPLIDVRAPIEYAKGAFPNSINLPLLNDKQRQQVGTCYKQQGKSAAIALGESLISGKKKQARLGAWQDYLDSQNAAVYCFRGGLRSKTVQRWLQQSGIEVPIIEGGYKAMRNYLLEQMSLIIEQLPLLVIGGKTGVNKTELINSLSDSIDLEGLAHHRGSSFGRRATEQPTVINFENNLAIELLKLVDKIERLVIEDEGVTIGRCALPLVLREKMQQAPLLILEAEFEQRLENIYQDYVVKLYAEYQHLYAEQAWRKYRSAMFDALNRISKRLGGVDYKTSLQKFQNAFPEDAVNLEPLLHYDWIQLLLKTYYDPMYEYQLKYKQARITMTADFQDLKTHLSQTVTKLS